MGLLFTPTNFLFLHHETREGQVKAVLLVTLMFLSLRRPNRNWPGTSQIMRREKLQAPEPAVQYVRT
jgi:hypothetical protein